LRKAFGKQGVGEVVKNRLSRSASRPRRSATSVRQSHLVCASWYRETYILAGDKTQDPVAHFLQSKGGDLVDPTPLFDGHWYRSVHGLHAVADPLDHYLTVGASMGLDPSPVFDSTWYMRQISDLPEGRTPLEHYLAVGGAQAIDPHPLFSTAWYLQQVEGGLDGLTPVEHYLAFGWRKNLDPCALFSANGYLHRNPDVAAGGVNPFVHYLKFGRAEGREGTGLWSEAEYRQWFADDVLVQRFGSLGHFREVVVPGGRSIDAAPAIDRVGRLRVALEERAERFLRTSDGGKSSASIDWSARERAIEFSSVPAPQVAVVIAGRGRDVLRTLESLLLSTTTVPFEVVLVGNDAELPSVPGVAIAKANPIDTHAVWTAALAVSTAPHVVLLDGAIDVAAGWLNELVACAGAGADAGMVASTAVGDELSLQESGRFVLDDGSVVRFGADDRVGRWMYGTDREIDSCSPYGALVRRSLLGDWLATTPAITREAVGESLSYFVRESGARVLVAPRAVLVERFDITFNDRTVSSPLAEQLRQRDRRSESHVLVIAPSVERSTGREADAAVDNLLRAFVASGRIVHLLAADAQRSQPWTEQLERGGIEVIDALLGSDELLALVASLDGKLEFVLVTDPVVGVRWASFLLEYLGDVPLVVSTEGVDQTDHRLMAMQDRVVRLADLVLNGDEMDHAAASVGNLFAAVGAAKGRRN
jgi:hypothetical protein